VDGEDIRSSGLVNGEVPLWSASGPIARRWIVPMCVWKLSDCKNGSECSGTVQVGRVRVFEEFLTVFNCSVLTFGVQ
jgi:hypothetical protein